MDYPNGYDSNVLKCRYYCSNDYVFIFFFVNVCVSQCVSVGYFVMGLVWKLHTDVIDESWIRILNRLWIGNLRLGSTVNGLVFTAICLFPVYVIAGTLGLVGVFCKKKICIVLVWKLALSPLNLYQLSEHCNLNMPMSNFC